MKNGICSVLSSLNTLSLSKEKNNNPFHNYCLQSVNYIFIHLLQQKLDVTTVNSDTTEHTLTSKGMWLELCLVFYSPISRAHLTLSGQAHSQGTANQ